MIVTRDYLRRLAASLGIDLPIRRTRLFTGSEVSERYADTFPDPDSLQIEAQGASTSGLTRSERKEFEKLANDPANGNTRRKRERAALEIIEARKRPSDDYDNEQAWNSVGSGSDPLEDRLRAALHDERGWY